MKHRWMACTLATATALSTASGCATLSVIAAMANSPYDGPEPPLIVLGYTADAIAGATVIGRGEYTGTESVLLGLVVLDALLATILLSELR
jgi:hypothetical protein